MEIRLHGPGQEPEALAVTMRTPGHDFELAVGFCVTEGLLHSADDLDSVAYCLAGAGGAGVQHRHRQGPRARSTARGHSRTFVANASCGLCGKTTLDDVEQHVRASGRRARCVAPVGARVACPSGSATRSACSTPPAGSTPPARFTADGELVALREDVGRHNALDKLVGHALLERQLPLSDDGAHGVGAGELRDRPEGGDGRDPDGVRGVGAVQPGGRRRAIASARPSSASCAATAPTSTPIPTASTSSADRSADRGLEDLGEDQVAQAHPAGPVGGVQAERHRRDQAEPLQGDARRPSGRTATTCRTRGAS